MAWLVLAGCDDAGSAEAEQMFGLPVSEYQDEVLADDVVTDAEYEAAWRAHYDCVSRAGVAVGPLERSRDGVHWEFSFSFSADEDPVSGPSNEIYLECESEYVSVLMVWKYNEAIPVGAERDAAISEMLSCLEGLGVTGVTAASLEHEIYQRIEESFAAGDGELMNSAYSCVEASFVFADPAPVDQ